MKIAIMIPPYDIISQGYGTKAKVRGVGNWPPLGAGYIAAVLEQKKHIVKIIDAPAKGYSNKEVVEEIKAFNPDVLGVSSVTASAKQAYSLIHELKKEFNLPIIFGGIHVTCFPEEVVREVPEVDIFVFGEGEETIVEVVDKLEKKEEMRGVLGIWYKDSNGQVIKNEMRKPIENLDQIPILSWHLYDFKFYKPLPLQYKKLPIAPVITSRGCPWRRCTYCFQAGKAAQPYRRHSPQRVIEEIKLLVNKYKIKEIAFWDDNFLINEKWINEFCQLLEKENIKVPWQCYGKVNSITPTMLKTVAKAGCWNVFYGLESGNQDLLNNINKGITLEQVKNAVKLTHEAGMDTRGSFMLALPDEDPSKALNTINFAIELDLTFAQFLPTHPEYGTPLYDTAIQSGVMVPKFHGRNNPTFIPKGYKNSDEVMHMVRKAYRNFYLRPGYFIKHVKRIKSMDDLKQYYDAAKFILGIGF